MVMSDSLGDAFFGKTRKAILSLLYGHPDEEFYVREIARLTGVGHGAMQRELVELRRAGIIERRESGRQVYYRANPRCPVYKEIRNLVTKTVGAAEVLRSALAPLSNRIQFAFIYGSVATGGERRASDIDVAVIGDVTFAEIARALGPAQERLGREVNPTVYSAKELRAKLGARHHFLTAIVKGRKVFLIGSEHELAHVAKERLAD
jgi:DNA-binding transcriptional ArsR family regulator